VVDVYVRSPSTAEPDCHHQMGSAKSARFGFGKWDVREAARFAALERNALATGAGVTLGMTVAAGVVVVVVVTIELVAMIELVVAIGVAEVAREEVVSEVVVFPVDWMSISG
jgi:hypothetical protein